MSAVPLLEVRNVSKTFTRRIAIDVRGYCDKRLVQLLESMLILCNSNAPPCALSDNPDALLDFTSVLWRLENCH